MNEETRVRSEAERLNNEAWHEGGDACRRGESLSANPYSLEDRRHRSWVRGWKSGLDFIPETSLAFSQGSDARLVGRPLGSCPYDSDSQLGNYWVAGWLDVQRNWGTEATHVCRRLPEVRQR